MIRLKDISLSKTEFYLRKIEDSNQDLRKLFWEDFKKVIFCMDKDVQGRTHNQTDYQNLEEPPFQQGRITPILSSPWVEKESDNFLRRFISRVFLDVFSLQIFLCKSGSIKLEKLDDIAKELCAEISTIREKIDKERLPEVNTEDNLLNSECLCYWVEFVSSRSIEKNTNKVFEIIFGSSDFEKIDFTFAKVAFLADGEDIKFCIIAKDLKESTVFFNDLLPEYLLSWSKVKNEESILKKKSIEKEREDLNNLLGERKHKKHLSLKQIEEMNFELSEKRTAFAERYLDVEFHLRTLDINISNAEKLLNKSLLAEQKDILKELWIKPLKLVAEQTEAYLSYYRINLEKSRIANEKVTNDATLKSAIYSRRLAFLFGLFSLIGILQLFPESFGKMNDGKKIIILLITILIFLIISLKSEIRNWFKKSE